MEKPSLNAEQQRLIESGQGALWKKMGALFERAPVGNGSRRLQQGRRSLGFFSPHDHARSCACLSGNARNRAIPRCFGFHPWLKPENTKIHSINNSSNRRNVC